MGISATVGQSRRYFDAAVAYLFSENIGVRDVK
jgi:hypothetical protein